MVIVAKMVVGIAHMALINRREESFRRNNYPCRGDKQAMICPVFREMLRIVLYEFDKPKFSPRNVEHPDYFGAESIKCL